MSDPKDPNLEAEKESFKAWYEYTQSDDSYKNDDMIQDWNDHTARELNAREIEQFLNQESEE